jgi:parvulin-like peptidyl-prolyl isomerase
VIAAILAVLFVVLFGIVALAQGIGDPSIPSDDVAVVEDAPEGDISQEEFQAGLEQAAVRQGIPPDRIPSSDDPQYAALRDAAMSDILLSRWVLGEAEERGITVSDTEVTNQIDQIKQQSGGERGFQQLLKQSGFTLEQAEERIRLQLLSNQIQTQVLGKGQPSVSEEEIKNFYEINKAQFTQPETRDVREIVNKDQAKVEQARAALEQDDSPANWKKVASKFSADPATKDSGGLRKAVAEGQSEPALDEQIFQAPTGELIGPFQGEAGYYLIQVEKVTPEQVTPLDELSEQIKQQLAQGIQQQTATTFQTNFTTKWVSRTFCAEGYVMDRCSNFTPPTQAVKGAPAVLSSGAVQPGETTVFPGQAPAALPQGPQYPAVEQPAVLGPGGAPQLPPGSVPPGSAPPQQVPPG